MLADRFESTDGWVVQVPPGLPPDKVALASGSFRASPVHGKLLVDSPLPGWLAHTLPAPLVGDFELSFDVHIVPASGAGADSCPLMVGVGDGRPTRAVDPEGVFVRVDSLTPCSPGAPGFSPRVNRKPEPWAPPGAASTPAADEPCVEVVAGGVDRWNHVTLTRHNNAVAVRVRDRDDCDTDLGDEPSVEYSGAIASPAFLLVGYAGVMGRDGWSQPCLNGVQSIAIDNMVLRTMPCAPETSPCSDAGESGCVDLLNSNEHCGACFQPVRDAEECEAGEPVCKGTPCTDPTSGLEVCTDLASDPNHCGACGNQLTRHEVCVNGLRLAKMVQAPEGHWIDSTEVTRAQYAAWLATDPSAAGQHPQCQGWHTNYTPVCAWPPGDTPSHPVVCIDWCDAYAYCEGVGKRMCGAVGGGPSPSNPLDFTSIANQWTAVCTSGGIHKYTFGDEYDPNACYGALNPLISCVGNGSGQVCDMGEAGGLETCQSPESAYAGVYDLIHNGGEAIDACLGKTGAKDTCPIIGSASNWDAQGACKSTLLVPRNQPDGHRAIRCCAW